jgi:hypothetical protein
LVSIGGGFKTLSEETIMDAKYKEKFDRVDANIEEAKRQLREIPIRQWKDLDFENHPKLNESEGLLFSIAKTFFCVKSRERSLGKDWPVNGKLQPWLSLKRNSRKRLTSC